MKQLKLVFKRDKCCIDTFEVFVLLKCDLPAVAPMSSPERRGLTSCHFVADPLVAGTGCMLVTSSCWLLTAAVGCEAGSVSLAR